MSLSIEDLTTPPTADEVKQSIYDVLGVLGVDVTNWKPGAVVRTIIAGCAIVIAACAALIASLARSAWIHTAEDDGWLDNAGLYGYGVARDEATFATGPVVLTATAGVFDYDIDDLVVINAATGKRYRNQAAVHVEVGSPGTVTVQAEEQGAASTALAGEITEFEVPENGLSVSNPAALVGTDAEDPEVYRARCLEHLGAVSPNGPPDAYAFVARGAKRLDGSKVGVNRVRATHDGFGGVDVYCATPTGAITGDPEDEETDLGAINDALQKMAGPLAVTVRTHSATAFPINIDYSAWVFNTTGQTEAQVKAAIEAALVNFLASNTTSPIGGILIPPDAGKIFRLGGLDKAIANAAGLSVIKVTITSPAVDPELGISDVAVLGTLLGSVTFVAPGQVGV